MPGDPAVPGKSGGGWVVGGLGVWGGGRKVWGGGGGWICPAESLSRFLFLLNGGLPQGVQIPRKGGGLNGEFGGSFISPRHSSKDTPMPVLF